MVRIMFIPAVLLIPMTAKACGCAQQPLFKGEMWPLATSNHGKSDIGCVGGVGEYDCGPEFFFHKNGTQVRKMKAWPYSGRDDGWSRLAVSYGEGGDAKDGYEHARGRENDNHPSELEIPEGYVLDGDITITGNHHGRSLGYMKFTLRSAKEGMEWDKLYFEAGHGPEDDTEVFTFPADGKVLAGFYGRGKDVIENISPILKDPPKCETIKEQVIGMKCVRPGSGKNDKNYKSCAGDLSNMKEVQGLFIEQICNGCGSKCPDDSLCNKCTSSPSFSWTSSSSVTTEKHESRTQELTWALELGGEFMGLGVKESFGANFGFEQGSSLAETTSQETTKSVSTSCEMSVGYNQFKVNKQNVMAGTLEVDVELEIEKVMQCGDRTEHVKNEETERAKITVTNVPAKAVIAECNFQDFDCPIPKDECTGDIFPIDVSGRQCSGLNDVGEVENREACQSKCCEDPECEVWQFCPEGADCASGKDGKSKHCFIGKKDGWDKDACTKPQISYANLGTTASTTWAGLVGRSRDLSSPFSTTEDPEDEPTTDPSDIDDSTTTTEIQCPGGSLEACFDSCPLDDPIISKDCMGSCRRRCPEEATSTTEDQTTTAIEEPTTTSTTTSEPTTTATITEEPTTTTTTTEELTTITTTTEEPSTTTTTEEPITTTTTTKEPTTTTSITEEPTTTTTEDMTTTTTKDLTTVAPCPGNSLNTCIDLCPADDPALYKACMSSCQRRCPDEDLTTTAPATVDPSTTSSPSTSPVETTTMAPSPTPPYPGDEACRTCNTMCSPCKPCANSQEGDCHKCWHCWDFGDDELEEDDDDMDEDCNAMHKDHDWADDEVRCLTDQVLDVSGKVIGGDGRRRTSPFPSTPVDCRACWGAAPPAPSPSQLTDVAV